MKKGLICIIIIAIIIVAIFAYIKLNKKNSDVLENTNNAINTIETAENFLLYIDEILQDGNNVKVIGTVSEGTINDDNEISIVGLGKKEVDSKVIKLEVDNKERDSVKKGEKVAITLDSNVNIDYIAKGQAVIILGTTKPIYNIDAVIVATNLNISEIIEKGNTFFINTDIDCSISIISEEGKKIKISLDVPIVIENGIEFVIKNDDSIIANCIVINE